MLIRFSIFNYLSFTEEQELTLVAGRDKQHTRHVAQIAVPALKLLPTAAIYGANGSGKTNFYCAIETLRHLILQPAATPEAMFDVQPFRLDDNWMNQPVRFVIELLAGERIFRLKVAVTDRQVISEELLLVGPGRRNAPSIPAAWQMMAPRYGTPLIWNATPPIPTPGPSSALKPVTPSPTNFFLARCAAGKSGRPTRCSIGSVKNYN